MASVNWQINPLKTNKVYDMVSSQLVPKSTRTHFWSTRTWPLVNSYLPQVNSYPSQKTG